MKSKKTHDKSSGFPLHSNHIAPTGQIPIGDLSLTVMAQRTDAASKRKSKIGDRIFIIICVVLSIAVIVAVLLPMLLGREPGAEDEPPFENTPDNTLENPPQDVPDSPEDPPVEPPKEEWVTGRLTFNMGTFLADYVEKFGKEPAFDYLLTFTYDDPVNVIDQCAATLLNHYDFNGQTVSVPVAYRYRKIVKTYIIDAALEVRLQTPFDQEASTEQTLLCISRAARRLAAILADNGKGTALIPDDILTDFEKSKVVLDADDADAYNLAQSTLWAIGSKERIESSLQDICQNTARALMVLLHGYTPPLFYDNPQVDPALQPYDEQMLEIMDQLAERLRELLDTVLIKEDPPQEITTAGFSVVKFYQAVMAHLPSLVEEFTDMTYEDFLVQVAGGKMEVINDTTYIFGRTDAYAQNVVIGEAVTIDFNQLSELVNQLSFEIVDDDMIDELNMTDQADIIFRHPHEFMISNWSVFGTQKKCSYPSDILPISLLTAGCDGKGNYYLRSANYAAILTEAQYNKFIKICSPRSADS